MSGLGYSCNLFHFKNPIMSPWIEYLDSRKNQQSLSSRCWRIQIGLFRFDKDTPQCYSVTEFCMIPLRTTTYYKLSSLASCTAKNLKYNLGQVVISCYSISWDLLHEFYLSMCLPNNCLSSGDKLFKRQKVLVRNSFPVKGYKQKIRQFIKESGCCMAQV